MECGICNAIKKWFTKKDDKGDKDDKDDRWFGKNQKNLILILTFLFLLILTEIDQIRKLNKYNKDKINLAIDLIDDLIKTYEYRHESFTISDQPDKVEVTKQTIDNLDKIKKILED